MNSSSDNPVSISLLMAPYQLNIYFGIFIFITGNISCIGNFIVYRSRLFRDRACSIYLFWEAFINLFYFNFVLVTRVIQKGFQIPVMNRYEVLCRLRQFASEYTHQVAFTLFTLTSIDRYLSAQRSIKLRRLSNRTSLAWKLVPAVYILWLFIVGHRLVLYSISAGICGSMAGFYKQFDNLFEVVMSGLCPPIILCIVGILLIRSIRNVVHRRVVPTTDDSTTTINNVPVIQQIDAQLSRMLFTQMLTAIPSFLPYGSELLYSNLSQNWNKSPLRVAWEAMFIELIHLLSYFFFSTSFYVSMVSSRGFRHQLLKSIHLKKIHAVSQPDTQERGQTANTRPTY